MSVRGRNGVEDVPKWGPRCRMGDEDGAKSAARCRLIRSSRSQSGASAAKTLQKWVRIHGERASGGEKTLKSVFGVIDLNVCARR